MGVNHPAAWRRNPRAVGAVSPCPPQWAKKRRRERHKVRDDVWQGQKDLNPRHAVLETAALPAELYPYTETTETIGSHADSFNLSNYFPEQDNCPPLLWWALTDLNRGPSGYEPDALTN